MKYLRTKKVCGRCTHLVKSGSTSRCSLGEDFFRSREDATNLVELFAPLNPHSCKRARQRSLKRTPPMSFIEELRLYFRFRWWFLKCYLLPRGPRIFKVKNLGQVWTRCRLQRNLYRNDIINQRKMRLK